MWLALPLSRGAGWACSCTRVALGHRGPQHLLRPEAVCLFVPIVAGLYSRLPGVPEAWPPAALGWSH